MAKKNIKNKILFNVSIVVLIGGLLTSAGTALISYQRELENTATHLSHETKLRTNKVEAFLGNSISLASSLSKEDFVLSFFENQNNQKNLKNDLERFRLKNGLSGAYISNTSGIIIGTTESEISGQDFKNYSFFQKAINGYSGVGALYDNTKKRTDLMIAEAIRNDNNQIIGTAIIKISAPRINYLLEENADDQAIDMLSDENGIVVASNDAKRINKSLGQLNEKISSRLTTENNFPGLVIESLGLESIESDIGGQKIGDNGKIYQNKGAEYIFNINKIGNTPLYFISEKNINVIKETANRLAFVLFLPTSATIIIIIILIYFLVLKTLEPIDVLKNEATQIGLGNFNQTKALNTGDELEDLENILIKTSTQLKDAYEEMEDKVRQRTLEIENKNKQAEKANLAMINIMEDIEKEKEKVSSLAKDLEKFKLALDNTSEQVLLADKTGAILYANKGMENLTGYKIKEVIGKKTADLWRIVKDEKAEAKMWSDILNKKRAITREMPSRRKDGQEYTTMSMISPILDENGNVEFIISISHDITKEKEIDRAKTEFVSLASHQLRTPLSSVNWYSEMLLSGDAGPLNEDQKSFVGEIYKGNQRMVDLVNSLLDVSRLELGTFTIAPEIIDICEPAKSVINELKPGISNKKIKLEMSCNGDLPQIKADPKLIRIVFQNLLSNAVKYTPEGGKVSLKIEKEDKNLLITVSDNGYGIPRNQHEKVFQKLFRADNVKAKDTEGTGLGLYIIKSILNASGGEIKFESEEDKGTTFFVRLPLQGMAAKKGDKVLGE